MRVNERGIALIKRFEGCSLRSYLCPAGVWTLGYGSTEGVKPGMSITVAQADEMLRRDLEPREAALTALLGKAKTTDDQFSAMCSLLFNIGVKNFKESSVLRCHKAGDHYNAARAFALWNRARIGGKLKVLPGLIRRRAAEAKLYRGEE